MSESAANALASPKYNKDLFPDIDVALQVEQMFLAQREGTKGTGIPAADYLTAKDDLDLNLIELIKGKMNPAAPGPPAAPIASPPKAPAAPPEESKAHDPMDEGEDDEQHVQEEKAYLRKEVQPHQLDHCGERHLDDLERRVVRTALAAVANQPIHDRAHTHGRHRSGNREDARYRAQHHEAAQEQDIDGVTDRGHPKEEQRKTLLPPRGLAVAARRCGGVRPRGWLGDIHGSGFPTFGARHALSQETLVQYIFCTQHKGVCRAVSDA